MIDGTQINDKYTVRSIMILNTFVQNK